MKSGSHHPAFDKAISAAMNTVRKYGKKKRKFAEGGDVNEWDSVPKDNEGRPQITINRPSPEPKIDENIAAAQQAREAAAEKTSKKYPMGRAYEATPPSNENKTWMMEPDLQESQTGELPHGVSMNDAGQPVNQETGEPLKVIPRPGMSPIASTPDGPRWTMPKAMDLFGNAMPATAGSMLARGVPTKAGEMVLGAGGIKKTPTDGLEEEIAALLKEANAPKASAKIDDPHAILDTRSFQPVSESQGTMPGGWRISPKDGSKWYVKEAPSIEQAANEKLTAELYKASGVPVADVRLTTVNGKPGIASKAIDGDQLTHVTQPYHEVKELHDNYVIDAVLGNHDAVGTGPENPLGNIIVDKNGVAHRIDTGGGLTYKGTGSPKAAGFGYKADEIGTMKDPKYSHLSAEVFSGISPEALKAGADKLAKIDPDKDWWPLIKKFGPKGDDAKAVLFDKLISRRQDALDQILGKEKPGGGTGGGGQLEQVPFTDHGIKHISGNHQQLLDDLYHNAPITDYLEQKKVIEGLAENNYRGKNWKKESEWEPAESGQTQKGEPEWEPPAETEWSPPTEYPDHIPTPPPAKVSLMKLNKKHQAVDYVGALENINSFSSDMGKLTQKQANKIFDNINTLKPEAIAGAILDHGLSSDQIKNIYSHLSIGNEKKVDDALASLMNGDHSNFFENTMHKGLHMNDPVEELHAAELKIYKQLMEHASKPEKSAAQREADRIAGGYSTPSWTGVRLPNGRENPHFSDEMFHSNMLDVAHAYTLFDNSAANPAFWDTKSTHVLKEFQGAAIQPIWLNTEGYIKINARGADWQTANSIALDERYKLAAKGNEPKGVIIENVHDMPHQPYQHPSGKPFTVYQSWDPGTRRSKFARFDKEHWNKTGMNLGIAGATVGGAGLLGSSGNGLIIGKPYKENKKGNEMKRGGSIAGALKHAQKFAAGGGEGSFFNHSAFKQNSRAGMIHSPIPGRTDKIPMGVKGGSYIMPADVVSGLGQGNSTAGAVALNKLFKQGPYGAAAGTKNATPHVNYGKLGHPMGARGMPKLATGGEAEHEDVPIIVAGGEYLVDPETVAWLGGGDIKHGHDILDNLVLHLRKKTIKDMQGLKPPKGSKRDK